MNPADWRKKRALTLKEAAELLGCSSASCVLRYERGEREAPTSVSIAYEQVSKDEQGKSQVTAADLNRVRQRYLQQHSKAA